MTSDRAIDILSRRPAPVATVVAIGLGLGILTQLGQGALPDDWSHLANSISPWLLVVFLVGSRLPGPRWAAAAGVAILVLALLGYYAMVYLRFGYGGSTSSLALWSIAAVAGGPVFGVAGRWWVDPRRWRRAIAIGLMSSAAVAEGWYLRGILPETAVGTGFIAAGLIVPLVLGRSWLDRAAGYLAVVPGLALGALGYGAFLAVGGIVAGI